MAELPFWSLENYWRIFSEELRQNEPLARWAHLEPLLYFAFHAGAAHIVSALAMREEFEGAFVPDLLVEYETEHLAAMTALAKKHEEAQLRLPNTEASLARLKTYAAERRYFMENPRIDDLLP